MTPDPRPVHHYWYHGFLCGFLCSCVLWGVFEIGRWIA